MTGMNLDESTIETLKVIAIDEGDAIAHRCRDLLTTEPFSLQQALAVARREAARTELQNLEQLATLEFNDQS